MTERRGGREIPSVSNFVSFFRDCDCEGQERDLPVTDLQEQNRTREGGVDLLSKLEELRTHSSGSM